MNNTTEIPDSVEETVYNDIFLQYLPVAVFFGVAALVGIIGNVLVVKFYGLKSQPKTSFKVLVRYLAYADLTVCILLLFGAIEIGLNINFKFRYLCKVLYFLDEWSIYTSVWIFAIISVDRYRKICQPFKQQMSERFARNSIPVILMITFVMSIRNVFIYDIVGLNVTVSENNVTDVTTGYHCASTTDPDIQIYVQVFHWFDVVACSSLFLIYFIVYSLITHKLVQHRNTLKAWHQYGIRTNVMEIKPANKNLQRDTAVSNIIEETKDESLDFSVLNDDFESSNAKDELGNSYTAESTEKASRGIAALAGDGNCTRNSGNTTEDKDNYKTKSCDYPNDAQTHEDNTQLEDGRDPVAPRRDESVDKSNVDGSDKDCCERNGRNISDPNIERKRVIRRSEYQITVMMLLVTIVFLLSLSSFFFASLMFRQDPHSELAIKPFTHFMIKCVFLNSVSNPVIYFIYNGIFRAFAKTFLTCKCRKL